MDDEAVAGGGWWTLPQALVWIVTRQETQVWEASGATAFDEVIRKKLAPNVRLKDPPIPAEAALHELRRAAAKNQISIIGRRWGKEEADRVPVDDGSVLGDYRSRAIIGISSHHKDGDYWTHLAVRSSECKARWPVEPPRIIGRATQTTMAPPPMPRMRGFGPSVDRPTQALPLAPTYPPTETYSPDRAPEQFKSWANAQHLADVIITVPLAEDAMRGPKDENGNRIGGLLRHGVGLSRATIRKWVEDLPEGWQAQQGIPPSRAK